VSSSPQSEEKEGLPTGLKTILLMGNPNVGKSVFFSRITGTRVIASNYPGTTVGFTKGHMKLGEEEVEVIDVPGTYTLEPTSKAEEIASQMLHSGDLIINVLDATNLSGMIPNIVALASMLANWRSVWGCLLSPRLL
jgi:small GTP-binding protein